MEKVACWRCGLSTDGGQFCSYSCKRSYSLRYDMMVFESQVVARGGCPGYDEMSRKEKRDKMKAWKKEIRNSSTQPTS